MAEQVTAPAGEEVEIALPSASQTQEPSPRTRQTGIPAVVGDHIAIELRDVPGRARSGGCRADCHKGVTPFGSRFRIIKEVRAMAGRNQGLRGPGRWGAAASSVIAADDLGTGAALRVHLKEQRVPEPAVNNVGLGPRLPGWPQASTLGIIPLSITPRAIKSWHSAGVRPRIRLSVRSCRQGCPRYR